MKKIYLNLFLLLFPVFVFSMYEGRTPNGELRAFLSRLKDKKRTPNFNVQKTVEDGVEHLFWERLQTTVKHDNIENSVKFHFKEIEKAKKIKKWKRDNIIWDSFLKLNFDRIDEYDAKYYVDLFFRKRLPVYSLSNREYEYYLNKINKKGFNKEFFSIMKYFESKRLFYSRMKKTDCLTDIALFGDKLKSFCDLFIDYRLEYFVHDRNLEFFKIIFNNLDNDALRFCMIKTFEFYSKILDFNTLLSNFFFGLDNFKEERYKVNTQSYCLWNDSIEIKTEKFGFMDLVGSEPSLCLTFMLKLSYLDVNLYDNDCCTFFLEFFKVLLNDAFYEKNIIGENASFNKMGCECSIDIRLD